VNSGKWDVRCENHEKCWIIDEGLGIGDYRDEGLGIRDFEFWMLNYKL
jgi:hypothetical protein